MTHASVQSIITVASQLGWTVTHERERGFYAVNTRPGYWVGIHVIKTRGPNREITFSLYRHMPGKKVKLSWYGPQNRATLRRLLTDLTEWASTLDTLDQYLNILDMGVADTVTLHPTGYGLRALDFPICQPGDPRPSIVQYVGGYRHNLQVIHGAAAKPLGGHRLHKLILACALAPDQGVNQLAASLTLNTLYQDVHDRPDIPEYSKWAPIIEDDNHGGEQLTYLGWDDDDQEYHLTALVDRRGVLELHLRQDDNAPMYVRFPEPCDDMYDAPNRLLTAYHELEVPPVTKTRLNLGPTSQRRVRFSGYSSSHEHQNGTCQTSHHTSASH